MKYDDPRGFVTGSIRMCRTPAFWTYLHLRTAHACTSEDAASVLLRQLLGISTRAELATNEQARQLWLALLKDFNNWTNEMRARNAVR